VWLGEAANDPIVPLVTAAFRQVDPAAVATVLPAPQSGAGTPFVHSLVDTGAHGAYITRFNAWLQPRGTGSVLFATPDPGPGGLIKACNDALPRGVDWAGARTSQRWRLLDDGAGWTATAAPYGWVTATRGCDGRGQDQWAGLALEAIAFTPSQPVIPFGQTAEHDLSAPAGRSFARVTARFRGWFRDLGQWRVGLYASSSPTGPIDAPVATCDVGRCHGLSTWPSGSGKGIAPAATGRDPDTVDALPSQTFALPSGTVRIAWRLTCASAQGCDGVSIDPGGDPAKSPTPPRPRDPIGHPAALTVTGITVRLAK
jgi:hypothetical protein